MKTDFTVPDYKVLGYTPQDKEALESRAKIEIKLNLIKRTSKELKQSRCKAYKYLIP